MDGILGRCLALLAVVGLCVAAAPAAAQSEKRVALVIGNGSYQQRALPTAANDAGLIAQTLQAAGFDVSGARDLDGDTLRHTFRDFIDKVAASGPDTVAMVYLSGYALQLNGENYFLPIDAQLTRDTDLAVEGVRLSDYIHQLATLPLRAGIFVVDAAHTSPFKLSGQPLAGGLALIEPDTNMLIAFNATPGTVGPNETGPYGAYARSLAEGIRASGLPLPQLFDQVRLRVSELTKGAELPWNAQNVQANFMFFEAAAGAPQAAPPAEVAQARTRAIHDFDDPRAAYAAALARDTVQGYEDFLAAFPNDAMAARVRAIIAARREAITWRRTYRIDTPDAYWSYLRRYPRGPHAGDARRRLAALAAASTPPPSFAEVDYDVPPPPPDEIDYVARPVIEFDDPDFGFVPPPPAPVYFLPPPEPDFWELPPPPPPIAVFVLPVPLFIAIPVYYQAPAYVVPPPNNIIFANIHNTVVINTVINKTVITPTTAAPAPAAGAPRPTPAVASVGPTLPPSVQRRATVLKQQGVTGPNTPIPGPRRQANLPNQPVTAPNPLPGARGGPPLPGQPAITNKGPNVRPTAPTRIPPAPTAALPNKPNVPPTTPAIRPRVPPPSQQRASPPPASTLARRPPPNQTPTIAPVHRTPPPAVVNRPPPVVNRPPPVVNRAPPVVNRPPPVVNRPPPVVNRPPPVVNRAPPVINRPPPPPPPRPVVVNRPPPPPPQARKCAVVNGQQVCR